MKTVRHLLSWLAIFACYLVVAIIASLLLSFVAFVVSQISSLALVVRIFIYLIAGTTLLGIALAPLHFGPAITAMISDAIYPSKSGTRYIVFATMQITLSGLYFVLSLIGGHLNIAVIYTVIYSILLILYGKDMANNREE